MNRASKIKVNINRAIAWVVSLGINLFVAVGTAQAAAGSLDLKTMATNITSSFDAVTKLITAGAYLGGLAFSISAIMKFKQHKDNPTQISIGQPIALVFIAASLLFLPTLLHITGNTMFGSGGASVAGPTGTVIYAS